MLWAYTDCLAKKGPILKSPADKFLVGADPVTGRNQQVDLAWEQLCLATGYELQIAKDQNFTLRINPSVNWGNGSTGKIAVRNRIHHPRHGFHQHDQPGCMACPRHPARSWSHLLLEDPCLQVRNQPVGLEPVE